MNIMENCFEFARESLRAKRWKDIATLKYIVEQHAQEVKGDTGNWCLVLRESVTSEANSLNTTNCFTILCSGCGHLPQDICKKRTKIFDHLKKDLVLIDLSKETNEIYYVLSNSGKKDEVEKATSVEELELQGKILYISIGQDPAEVTSREMLKSYFGNNKKPCSNIEKCYIQMVINRDVPKLKTELINIANIKCAIDENGWTLLHHAVYHGNLEIVTLLTSMGFDEHAQDTICGRKPVIIAAREGHIDIIEFFLLKGLSVNEVDKIGWTLLHYAAWKGNSEAVRFLIQKNAQIDAKDRLLGNTPFIVAISEGHLDVVKLLADLTADLNARGKDDRAPLHYAVLKRDLMILDFLVSRGADPNVSDKKGWTPLHYAANRGQLKIVEHLLDKKVNINAGDRFGWKPIHHAASNGYLEVVRFLVDKSADINAEDEDGQTPFHHAAKKGQLRVLEFLFDRGADFDAKENKYLCTPLHHAACRGHLKIVEFLVSISVYLNAEDKRGWTPLHYATSKGHLDIIEYLVDGGANFNAEDERGWTPLYQAANKGDLEVVKFLFEKGADLNAQDNQGRTPFLQAAYRGHSAIVEFIADRQNSFKSVG